MRLRSGRVWIAAIAVYASASSGLGTARAADPPPGFRQDVLPILQQHCIKCHAEGQIGYQAIGLDLTNYRGLMSGSRHGPAVIPREPQLGTLMKVLDFNSKYYVHMPPMEHQLPPQDLATIKAWIAAGAKDN